MPKKNNKENSLSEKLTSLIHTKPRLIESDDEDIVTVDKITSKSNDEDDYSADELIETTFHKFNNQQFLADEDKKYLGKDITRKDLFDSEGNITESEKSTDSESEYDSNISNENEDSDNKLNSNINDKNEEEFDSESDTVQPTVKESHKKKDNHKPEDENFNRIFSQVGKDIEKGQAIKSQLHLWEFLLECRMKFHVCLSVANQLPTFKTFAKFQNDSEFKNSISQVKKSIKHLLRSQLALQEYLLKFNSEYLNSLKKVPNGSGNAIHSDEESEEIHNQDSINIADNKLKSEKLSKLKDFSSYISNVHKSFENYRNSTIQKWNDKTKIEYINNKNFSAFEQSSLKQIEQVLMDKQRLITRTQTKRSNYTILGQHSSDEPPKKYSKLDPESSEFPLVPKNKITINKEIFDDDDFYHQLLSELVKRKANDLIDPVQLGRQWTQLQQIRSKMKKKVDTRASKGRKVRYVVHPKLVNFMMPIDNILENEESRAELLNSLFGRKKLHFQK